MSHHVDSHCCNRCLVFQLQLEIYPEDNQEYARGDSHELERVGSFWPRHAILVCLFVSVVLTRLHDTCRAFCFQSAARLQHGKFTHPDMQVKSERVVRTWGDLNPLCLPVSKDSSFLPSNCVLAFLARAGGTDYLDHVFGETRLPISILIHTE
ncbi:hypothetical protein B0F90DRAFT_942765 [Multifurca ochricompacta]|uniref:Uncharacterized protein n=1 Tax=Multifurca ochricompacta TaxID=376703 RepID=A0AAD4M9U0_9AGAM|nr:hypothetical protein B0F90DRAFT_942765 [Multifurca ochricompacta]